MFFAGYHLQHYLSPPRLPLIFFATPDIGCEVFE